jgi:putative transcriptional regulator
MKNNRYRSEALKVAHEAARDLFETGVIDKITMRQFDTGCLTPVTDMKPQTIKRLRRAAEMSQAVFASALNVPVSLVSQWERGEKRPSGPSLKLLALIKGKGIDAIL